MNIQQLLDEAELCGSPGGCYLRNQKAIYTAEPPDISNELTIVSKYHHGGRLRKAILSAISSTCRPFIVLSKIPITEVKIYLVLAAQSSSPENKFNHCFFFLYFPSFLFLSFLLSISCSAVNIRGVASP